MSTLASCQTYNYLQAHLPEAHNLVQKLLVRVTDSKT